MTAVGSSTASISADDQQSQEPEKTGGITPYRTEPRFLVGVGSRQQAHPTEQSEACSMARLAIDRAGFLTCIRELAVSPSKGTTLKDTPNAS